MRTIPSSMIRCPKSTEAPVVSVSTKARGISQRGWSSDQGIRATESYKKCTPGEEGAFGKWPGEGAPSTQAATYFSNPPRCAPGKCAVTSRDPLTDRNRARSGDTRIHDTGDHHSHPWGGRGGSRSRLRSSDRARDSDRGLRACRL